MTAQKARDLGYRFTYERCTDTILCYARIGRSMVTFGRGDTQLEAFGDCLANLEAMQ